MGDFKITVDNIDGKLVALLPLGNWHAETLFKASRSEAIWSYMPPAQWKSVEETGAWINQCLAKRESGEVIAYAVIEKSTGELLGTSQYLNINAHHARVEIGFTFYCPRVQRTGINTECKYLLIQNAFEAFNTIRVEFKTDSRNVCSQKALERIGATLEGTLRNHMILHNGHIRDSVYYSIIQEEWPEVKVHLEKLMQKYV